MEFTKEQLSELICKHTEKENGLHKGTTFRANMQAYGKRKRIT